MMKANEAIQKSVAAKLEELQSLIDEATTKGKFGIAANEELNKDVVKALEKLGYRVIPDTSGSILKWGKR